MNKIKKFIGSHKILLILILLALLLRLPWLYTTIERDEGIFGYVAWQALEGEPIYTHVMDNKPPLLYFLYAIPIKIFGNSIIPIRMFNNLLFITSIFFFFLLVKRECGKRMAILSSVFYILLMNIPSAEGPLAVSESFMIPFFIISVYFLSLFLKEQNYFHLGISVILMCIASLIRHNALGGLFLIYFILLKKKVKYKEMFLITPPVLFLSLIAYFIYSDSMSDILKIILNIQTVIPFKYSLLVILESAPILLFAFAGIVIVQKKKKKYSLTILWFLSLIPFLFFPVSFHHLLTLAPPVAVFAGFGFNNFSKRRWAKESIFIIILLLLLALSLPLIIKQYPNYHFRLSQVEIKYSDLESYQQQIMLSNYIKSITAPKDKLLIWGWEPGIFWLSGRDGKSPPPKKGFLNLYCNKPRTPPNLDWKKLEKEQYSDPNLKAIIFLPGYSRKCENMTKEIFSDLYFRHKEKIYDVEIYLK